MAKKKKRKKLSEEAKRKRRERMLEKRRQEQMQEDGYETFFGNSNSFIPAGEEEYEGHYPGNQNNAILIPRKKKQVVHVS